VVVDRKAIVVSAIKHRQTDLCPYVLDWEGDVGERLDAFYGSDRWRTKFRNYIHYCACTDDGKNRGQEKLVRDVYGSGWRTDRRPYHLEDPVLKDSTLRGYRFPDPDQLFSAGWDDYVREYIKNNSDCFIVGGISMGLLERSWSMRGFAEALADAAGEPEFYRDLIAAIADHHDQLLDRFLPLPFDGVMFGDDWGDQRGVILGPDRWRDMIKPHYAKLYSRVKAAGKFVLTHCCGSVADILPDMIEIGLDVLESVQPEARGMNPYELKKRYGDKITFWGGLGSQSIIPFGTPDELRTEIRNLAGQMGKGGGYILAGSKGLQPETPTPNAVAILEEFTALGN